MIKDSINDVRMTVGQARFGTDGIEPKEWGPWRRTFLFVPRKDIHGNFILGPAWMRRVKHVIRELEHGGYIMIDMDEVEEFSRSKKDIFVRELNGNN